jgi:acetyltransferase-like isoleucine patch superfamily enzyme
MVEAYRSQTLRRSFLKFMRYQHCKLINSLRALIGLDASNFRQAEIAPSSRFSSPGHVDAKYGSIKIRENVRIAARVVVIPEYHIHKNPDMPITFQGMSGRGASIGSDVWIGTGARILDGVTVGEGYVIRARALVSRYLPRCSGAVGIPARAGKARLG